jgi:molybdopterin converting factor small subunit
LISVNLLLLDRAVRELLGKETLVVKLQNNEATVNGLVKKLDKKLQGKISKAISRPTISILVNGQDIEFLGGNQTRLVDGDRIAIIPLVAGG